MSIRCWLCVILSVMINGARRGRRSSTPYATKSSSTASSVVIAAAPPLTMKQQPSLHPHCTLRPRHPHLSHICRPLLLNYQHLKQPLHPHLSHLCRTLLLNYQHTSHRRTPAYLPSYSRTHPPHRLNQPNLGAHHPIIPGAACLSVGLASGAQPNLMPQNSEPHPRKTPRSPKAVAVCPPQAL